MGAAGGAVAAVAYLAHELGAHGAELRDQGRRLDSLERTQDAIFTAIRELKNLIVGNGA